ncbi:hypothetical protein [Bifidobacterium castoris]|uniref:hypothetical protein n=1 Tax=Bifidobacterium castoris TaxID=2306972 RepID=UPI000F7D813E|nr:hypothetical protein [Bifidobacterium castoris]
MAVDPRLTAGDHRFSATSQHVPALLQDTGGYIEVINRKVDIIENPSFFSFLSLGGPASSLRPGLFLYTAERFCSAHAPYQHDTYTMLM